MTKKILFTFITFLLLQLFVRVDYLNKSSSYLIGFVFGQLVLSAILVNLTYWIRSNIKTLPKK